MKNRVMAMLAVAALAACMSTPTLPATDAAWTAERFIAAVWDLPPEVGPASQLTMQSSEIERLRVQMQNRYVEMKPELDAGVIGLGSDGFVAVREPEAVPIADRARLRALVANENADRSALYRQIAMLNDEPSWQSPLRDVFAQRWIVRAAPDWWIRDDRDHWQRKSSAQADQPETRQAP